MIEYLQRNKFSFFLISGIIAVTVFVGCNSGAKPFVSKGRKKKTLNKARFSKFFHRGIVKKTKKKSLSEKLRKYDVASILPHKSAFSSLMKRVTPKMVPVLPNNNPVENLEKVEFTNQQILQAGDYANLLLGNMDYKKRKIAFQKLFRSLDPKAENALILILNTSSDPFSQYCISLLSKLNTKKSNWALKDSLADSRPTVRALALIELIKK